jgi:hypothetical protein
MLFAAFAVLSLKTDGHSQKLILSGIYKFLLEKGNPCFAGSVIIYVLVVLMPVNKYTSINVTFLISLKLNKYYS